MRADHDNVDDEVLQHVIGELRRPVQLDPSVDRRAMEQIRAESAGWTAAPSGRRLGAWIAGATIAAGVLLAVALPDREGAAQTVRLRLAAPASSRVAVVGDFNDWDPAATPLRPAGEGGAWVVELRLEPGIYHYTFLVDGRRWQRDPAEPPAAESDFGAPVSVLTVS